MHGSSGCVSFSVYHARKDATSRPATGATVTSSKLSTADVDGISAIDGELRAIDVSRAV
jgi:hypothetical protein